LSQNKLAILKHLFQLSTKEAKCVSYYLSPTLMAEEDMQKHLS